MREGGRAKERRTGQEVQAQFPLFNECRARTLVCVPYNGRK